MQNQLKMPGNEIQRTAPIQWRLHWPHARMFDPSSSALQYVGELSAVCYVNQHEYLKNIIIAIKLGKILLQNCFMLLLLGGD